MMSREKLPPRFFRSTRLLKELSGTLRFRRLCGKACGKALKRPLVSSLSSTEACRGLFAVRCERDHGVRVLAPAHLPGQNSEAPEGNAGHQTHAQDDQPAKTKISEEFARTLSTSFTGTFWFQVRLVSYFTCASTVRRNRDPEDRWSRPPAGRRAWPWLPGSSEIPEPVPGHVRGRVIENRQAQRTLWALILTELASAPR